MYKLFKVNRKMFIYVRSLELTGFLKKNNLQLIAYSTYIKMQYRGKDTSVYRTKS
jgi:hypothetical protein